MDPTQADHTLWGYMAATSTAIALAVRWWYHTRKLENADKVDGGVTKSIGFVLGEMRAEITRLREENKELRAEINDLRDRAVGNSSLIAMHEMRDQAVHGEMKDAILLAQEGHES